MRLARLAVVGVPALAVGVTALVLLGPGRARPVVGARLWGVPVETTGALALRVETAQRYLGLDDIVAVEDLTFDLPGKASRPWTGATGADGIAEIEVELAEELSSSVPVRLRRGREVLIEAELDLVPPSFDAPTPAIAGGATSGDIEIQVDVPRGHVVSPFPGELRVTTRREGEPVRATVALSAPGATVSPPKAVTDEQGVARFEVEAVALTLDLEVEASDVTGRPDARGRWQGKVPIDHGAVFLEPATLIAPGEADGTFPGGEVTLRFRSARSEGIVYASIVSDRGRLRGLSVPLTERGGFGVAEVSVSLPRSRWLNVVTATDPFEQADSTVAWPLFPREGVTAAPRLALLVDGMPQAEQRELARAWAAKRSAVIVVAAAALLEVLLLIHRSRLAQRTLQEHLVRAAGAGDDDALSPEDREKLARAGNPSASLLVGVFVVLVVLAFAVVATLSLFR